MEEKKCGGLRTRGSLCEKERGRGRRMENTSAQQVVDHIREPDNRVQLCQSKVVVQRGEIWTYILWKTTNSNGIARPKRRVNEVVP